MYEPKYSRPQVDQIITEVHLLLNRCESRLSDLKSYSARYSLIHDIKDAYLQFGEFEAFRARVVAGIDRNLSAGQTESVILSRAYCLLGLVNSVLENKDVSLQNYQQAMYLNLSEAKVFAGLATYHYGLKDYKTASQFASQAIMLNPKIAEGYATRGACLYTEDKYDEAIAEFKKAADLDHEEIYYLTWLASIYYQLEDYPESIAYYNKALELDPTYLSGFNSRGHVYLNMKMYANAIADYEQAARLDPDEAYKYTSTFGDVKPVNGFLLGGFTVAIMLVMGLPLVFDEFQVLNRLIFLQIGGWLVLAAVFILGNLRPKDIGLTFKNLLQAVLLIVCAVVLLQILGQVFRTYTRRYEVLYYLPSDDFLEANEFPLLLLYFLPPMILQELLCRGFLLPQLFLKLRGPYRAFSSLAISTSFAIVFQFEIITIAMVYVEHLGNILFALVLVGYSVTQLYRRERNIVWTVGVAFLICASLDLFMFNVNALIFAQVIIYIPSLVSRYVPKPAGDKLKVIDERVNHNTRFTRLFDSSLTIVGIYVGWYVIVFMLNGLDDSRTAIDLSTLFLIISAVLVPLVAILPEIVSRIRRKPAL